MKVFLAMNVIVSAFASRGLCADLFREVLLRHQLVVSPELLDEVRSVLIKKIGIPSKLAREIVDLLEEAGVRSLPESGTALSIQDPMDRALVAAAIQSRAEVFVTGDKKLSEHAASVPLEMATPRQFWVWLRAGG